MRAGWIAIVGTLTLFAAGCASQESGRQEDRHQSAGSRSEANTVLPEGCHHIRGVWFWQAIDDQHFYVESTDIDDRYLLTTTARCPGILYSGRVDFPSSDGVVCGNGANRVAYLRAGLRRTCGIARIDAINALEDAEYLVRRKQNAN